MAMRVCLDARRVGSVASGHNRYELQLIGGLAQVDRRTDYVVILNEDYRGEPVNQANFTIVRVPSSTATLRNFLFGAKNIDRIGADVYHCLHQFLPLGIRTPAILTLHDLFAVEYPALASNDHWFSRQKNRIEHAYGRIALPSSLRRASHVVAVSQHTADLAERHMGTEPSRMTVVPHGVADSFLKAGESTSPPAEGETPYFMMVGNSSWNKNVPRVIDALAHAGPALDGAELRIAGRGDAYGPLGKHIARRGLEASVRLMKQVPDAELVAMLQGAVAMVFPSLAEGFGIPLIEAQALRCPVITSDRGVLPEVAGDAALLVDPYSVEAIAAAMGELYRDPGLRGDLAARGRAHAEAFTWQRTAEMTRQTYEKVMDSTPQTSDTNAALPSPEC